MIVIGSMLNNKGVPSQSFLRPSGPEDEEMKANDT
jgi:hypothetical protein